MKTPTIRLTRNARRSKTDRTRRWNVMLTRKSRKIRTNPFPERRKTNKFRESHPQK
jgi:hypothetical protein